MEEKYIDVFVFDEEYDEQAEAKIYNILDKKLCIKHKWVNASLQWIKNGYWVELVTKKATPESTEWGFYGKFRFCKKCKKIDCIHYLDETRLLRRWENSKDYSIATIQHCKRCGKWIYTHGCGVIKSYAIDADTREKIYL